MGFLNKIQLHVVWPWSAVVAKRRKVTSLALSDRVRRFGIAYEENSEKQIGR